MTFPIPNPDADAANTAITAYLTTLATALNLADPNFTSLYGPPANMGLKTFEFYGHSPEGSEGYKLLKEIQAASDRWSFEAGAANIALDAYAAAATRFGVDLAAWQARIAAFFLTVDREIRALEHELDALQVPGLSPSTPTTYDAGNIPGSVATLVARANDALRLLAKDKHVLQVDRDRIVGSSETVKAGLFEIQRDLGLQPRAPAQTTYITPNDAAIDVLVTQITEFLSAASFT